MAASTAHRSAVAAPAAPARVGRPPRVSHQAIIAAALELGLEQVSLKQIADHLGVAQATLYRHVRNRDELLRLAAFELTLSRRLPNAQNAHWSELAARYAETLAEAFVTQPQLISELLKGSLGPHAEVDVLEQFLEALAPHGFSGEEGVALFHALGGLALGAAAGSIGYRASLQTGASWPQQLRRTLAERDPQELARVRAALPAAVERNPAEGLPGLRALLAGVAAARGETLPQDRPQDTGRR
ncbi:MAG TPA: helix-turn-helix domain-containing protein [Solimonas sp.]|nr:helix-turn-helix domain-containing protein [Solimonas sp.]